MYAFIRGIISYKAENLAVLDCGGVGYEIWISQNTLSSLGKIGEEATLYTYLNVREDEMSLFGFASQDEKNLFLKLITVSGVGSKTAINILSNANFADIQTAIFTGDVNFISKIKGIGKKTAERIALELKDKVTSGYDLFSNNSGVSGATDEFTQNKNDAIEALVSLGIQKAEATRVVLAVACVDDKAEEIIAKALRHR